MPFQAVPDGATAVIHGRVDDQDVFTTLGFKKIVPGTITSAEAVALATGVYNYWAGSQIAILPAAYELLKVVVNVLDADDGPEAEFDPGVALAGDLAGAVLPNNVTLALAFITGLHGRTNRGRNFWPLFLESEVVNNLVDVTKAGNIKDAYDGMIGPAAVAAGWTWAVISRKVIDISGFGRAVPIANTIFHNLVIDSQRRRLPGRGR